MKKSFSSFGGFLVLVVLLTTSAFGQDGALEAVLEGAKVAYLKNNRLYIMEVGQWNAIQIASNLNDTGNTVKWAATGDLIAVANGSRIKVYDIHTKSEVFSKFNLSINGKGGGNYSMEFGYDGKHVYFVDNRDIKKISLSTGQISKVYTTKSEFKIGEGEFGISENGKRFAGRYSNQKAVYIDIDNSLEGTYDNECSACISPGGTRLAVNSRNPLHTRLHVSRWPLTADSPSHWRNVDSRWGKWDNHTWSNHEDWVIGSQDECALINVNPNAGTASYKMQHGTESWYPDLWIPANKGGVVPSNPTYIATKNNFSNILTVKASNRLMTTIRDNQKRELAVHEGAAFSILGQKMHAQKTMQPGKIAVVKIEKTN
ncbi:MAG: hypothetical protein GF398_06730 [Chitinivibrionales bacterium]|nr:hypothetical protein [Chitinivibrionales bacterium]